MAAHVLTGLREAVGWTMMTDSKWNQLQAALDLSTWTEDLDDDDYHNLCSVVRDKNEDALIGLIAKILPVYYNRWQYYGKPRTREEWLRIKWEGDE